MTTCDVLQAGSGDDRGEYCSQRATAQCSDCGMNVCESHAEVCEACGETFCLSCLAFHQSEHRKPTRTEQDAESPKKKTA